MKSFLTRCMFGSSRMPVAGTGEPCVNDQTVKNPQSTDPGLVELILKATSSLVAVLDKESRFIYVSPSHKRLLGYDPEDLTGRLNLDFAHPEDRDRLSVIYTKALAGKIDNIKPLPFRLLDKAGRIRYAQMSFDIIRDTQGNPDKIVCVGDDITERMEIEAALAESEQRLQTILDTTPSPIAEVDRQGRFQFVNKAYSRFCEYSVEELKNMSIKDIAVSGQDGEQRLELLEQLAVDQQPPFLWESRSRSKSGRIMNVVVNWNYKKNERGQVTGFAYAITDITEQRKAAVTLLQSQQRYQAMFDNVSSGMAVYQPVDQGQDFLIIDFNKGAEQIEKTSREEVIGQKVTEVFPGVKSFGLLGVLQRVNQTGRPEHHPIALYQDDRICSWRENHVYKLPSGEIVAVYNDQTDRVRAEEALRESEARFRSLMEYSADHIFLLNSDGQYLFSNDRLGKLDVSRGDTLTGKNLEDAYPPEVAARFRRLLAQVHQHGHATSFEHEVREKDGLSVYLSTLYPIYKDGRQWAVGGISRDITARKKYEQELEQKTRELENAVNELRRTQRRMIDQERQLALSLMASGIAHDFNNSLTSIQGFSDLLLQAPERMNDPEIVREYITLINKSAKDAAQIVKRLQKFYRPSQDKSVEPVDLKTIIGETLALTEPIWKSKAQAKGAFITIEKQLGDQAMARGNRSELHEVVTNLIFNAVDAMPKGGTMRFVTRREDDWITLEISDTGIGMDAAVLKQCLNPFYTTKGEAGSGLGLPTVQAIIIRHEGQLDIRSQPGRGTTFSLRLPAAANVRPPAAADEPLNQNYPSLKILIVDDEERQRHLLEEYLKKDRHLTETAVNGLDGLRKFNGGQFDLVITDQAMPELNGDAMARRMKETHPAKPIIMLTGFVDLLDPAGKKPEVVDLLISKPVSLKQLREAIRQVLPKNKPSTGEHTRLHGNHSDHR